MTTSRATRMTLISFLVVCLLVPFFAAAQSPGYKVTPRIIDREVNRRDIFSETISVTNNRNHQINIYATVNQVDVGSGGDITGFTPPSMSDNTVTPTSWIAVSRKRHVIPIGETMQIPLEFKIHPEAEPGVYHVLIGFGRGHNREIAEQQVKDGNAPGVIVTLSVEQERQEFLKLSRFIIDRFVTKPDNSAVSYTLDNPGDADVVPTGEIIFYDGRGEEVTSIPVNPAGDSLTPGQETTYKTAVPVEGMFGKYKAFLNVDYGSEQVASVYDTAFFYVVPWQKLLIIFGTLMLAAIIITIFLHRRLVGEEYDHDGSEEVPLFVKDSLSPDQEHDVNLKQ